MQDSSTDARYAQLASYIMRGWALVPLHDVAMGGCSCGGCRTPGKHPRSGNAWQRPENLVRDEGGLRAALAVWPSCNWGLATGLVSQPPLGLWALDYDPAHVDPMQAAEVDAVLGVCRATAGWWQRTGGGGEHFLFTLPPDFVPNNSSRTLPAGFDVRGARQGEASGGQIVIAPSVTNKGSYTVLRDDMPGEAPALVLGAVRPAPPKPRPAAVPLQLRSDDAVSRYIASAVESVAGELRRSPDGSRNNTAVRTAYRLIELANTGYVGMETVYEAWWAAGKAHPDPAVTVPDAELLGIWGRAERQVGDRPADLSGVGGPSSWWGGDAIRPTSAPAVPLLGGGPTGAMDRYPQGVHGVVDSEDDRYSGVTNGVTSQVDGVTDPVTAMIARMMTPEQLQERPNPEPLINGILDVATTAWLIGSSGSFKSFVALDWAAHVGLGRPWRGHDVRQGLVIYVVAEGDRGMKLREAAWRREHGPMKDVLFLAEPVQADERRTPGAGGWSVLVEACRRLQPVLVIIDTQARVTIGLKENDNSDMSYYAEQADRIKRATGACVLTVHHTGRDGGDARGASSLDAAQDAELKVKRKDKSMVFELITDKQKDQAEPKPMTIAMQRSDGGIDPQTGRDLSSLVLAPPSVPLLTEASGPYVPEGTVRARRLYQLIRDTVNHGEGGTRSALRGLLVAELVKEGAKPNTAGVAGTRAWNDLIALGLIMRADGRGERFKVLVLTDQGPDGVLTPNEGEQAAEAPEGWSIWWPDNEKADVHAKTMMKRAGQRKAT